MINLPAAYVDVWPADGGSVHLSSFDSIMSVSTFKDIWDTKSGSFEVILPPGGPEGPNGGPQWADIITPMSLAVIGLQRGVPYQPRAHIIMVGVVTRVEQDVEWRFGAGVRRVCRVSGQDFSYFFAQESAYSETLLKFASGVGVIGLEAGLASNGIDSGSPDKLALDYYNSIMAGKQGIMSGTKFAYNGSSVPWSTLVQTDIQPYPNLPSLIPCAWNYLAVEGTWASAFQTLLPFPWYEFAILTLDTAPAAQISMGDVPMFLPASPVVMARPLPLPRLLGPDGGSLYMKDWDALPVYQPDNGAVLAEGQSFDVNDVRNFYVVNPNFLNTLYGASNQHISPWIYNYAAWIDVGGIQRYGYKPSIHNIIWFADPKGLQAQQNAGNEQKIEQLVADIALVPVSFHEPTPFMANVRVTLNLRPDIPPGVKFRYPGDKAATLWDAYVRTVAHSFVFGQASTTTLGLARALPTAVYGDENLLLALHTGKGAKIDGVYTTMNGTGIQPFNLTTAQSELESLSKAYFTAGQK